MNLERNGFGNGIYGGNKMLIFNKLANIFMVTGMLLVVFELLKAVKLTVMHPIQNRQNILNTVKQLRQNIENLNTQLTTTTGSNENLPSEENSDQEMQ